MNTTIDQVADQEPEIMAIKVTNANDFPISDRFDGVPYTFLPGRPENVPVDAAFHIFGWFRGVDPEAMKLYVKKRFGWNTPDMLASGRSDIFYGALKFQPIMYRMIPVELDDEGKPIDLPKATRPNKLMDAATERARAHAGA